MKTPIYPPLDEATLKVIAMNLSENPKYLSDPTCPYTPGTIALLSTAISTDNPSEVNGLERQRKILNKMRKQLDEQSKKVDTGDLEASVLNAYFRQRMNVEKEILELEERIHYIENVDAFYATVLRIMEEVLDTDQKDSIMNQLRAIKEKES